MTDTQLVWFCLSCDTVIEDEYDPDDAIYECGECGTRFAKSESPYGNHQCECGRFAARDYDVEAVCPNCLEDSETEQKEATIEEVDGVETYVVDKGVYNE